MEKKENINVSYRDPETNRIVYVLDEEHLQRKLDKAREEGKRELIESINEAFQKKII